MQYISRGNKERVQHDTVPHPSLLPLGDTATMARNKITARKSTGGWRPPVQLATEPAPQDLSMWTTSDDEENDPPLLSIINVTDPIEPPPPPLPPHPIQVQTVYGTYTRTHRVLC